MIAPGNAWYCGRSHDYFRCCVPQRDSIILNQRGPKSSSTSHGNGVCMTSLALLETYYEGDDRSDMEDSNGDTKATIADCDFSPSFSLLKCFMAGASRMIC